MSGLIQGAVSSITKQGDMIESAVSAPLKGLVNQVSGGMWKGDGANRFVEEMTNEVIPMLARIFLLNSNFATGINKSHARMLQCFTQTKSQAQTLHDVFTDIF
jgi:hypothetical protein